MKSLNFYDLRDKESFSSNKYTKSSKMVNGRKVYFAKTMAPSGVMSSRILSKADFNSK